MEYLSSPMFLQNCRYEAADVSARGIVLRTVAGLTGHSLPCLGGSDSIGTCLKLKK
jgi:hypothetical protein